MANNNTHARLTKGSVEKTLIGLTIPMIFGLMGIIAFNMVDMFFVGKLGGRELAALSFTFPVVTVIGSITLGLGVGAAGVISRAIGEGNHHKVQELTTDSIVLALLLGIMVVISGSLTIDPLFRLLGAKDDMLPLVREYMKIWYAGVLFVVVPMVGNNAIRAAGDMKTPSIIMLVSVVINIVLDPLLIFGIGPFPRLELAGAAIATVIARALTLVFAFYVLIRRNDMITFVVRPLKDIVASWKAVLYLGVPSAGARIIIPVATGVITRIVASHGVLAVAGFGVATRIEFLALTVVYALAVVMGPFVGQNWGASMSDRVRLGVNIGKRFAMIWGAITFIFLAPAAGSVATIFNNDPEVTKVVTLYLGILPATYGFFGIMVITASVLTVLHRPMQAMGLMAIQMFGVCVPLALAGSYFFGVPGIFVALAAGYVTAGVLANSTLSRTLCEVHISQENGIIV